MDNRVWPFGHMGNHDQGEIEITEGSFDQLGGWAFRNQFIGVRNDAVVFPDGRQGEYISVHAPQPGRIGGVAILPLFQDQLVLCRNFRHAPRRWELEIPRGFIDEGETPEAAASREMKEEYGVAGASMIDLGCVNADTGLMAYDVACYACMLSAPPKLVGEEEKREPVILGVQDAVRAIARNEVRDGFLYFAVLSAFARGLVVLENQNV